MWSSRHAHTHACMRAHTNAHIHMHTTKNRIHLQTQCQSLWGASQGCPQQGPRWLHQKTCLHHQSIVARSARCCQTANQQNRQHQSDFSINQTSAPITLQHQSNFNINQTSAPIKLHSIVSHSFSVELVWSSFSEHPLYMLGQSFMSIVYLSISSFIQHVAYRSSIYRTKICLPWLALRYFEPFMCLNLVLESWQSFLFQTFDMKKERLVCCCFVALKKGLTLKIHKCFVLSC